jgi:DNA-binding NarL/FixJ family response regulator
MSRSVTSLLTGDMKETISAPPETSCIKTILVETHGLMRRALHRVVASFPQVEIVAIVDTIQEVLANPLQTQAHVIVLGISIPTSDCLQVAEHLRKYQSEGALVVIRPSLRPEMVMALIKRGIHGLLDECASEQDLATAITIVAAGSIFLNRHAREVLTVSMSQVAISLTEREMEVAILLRRGESNFRIAQSLGLKEKTIEAYLTRIYSKLGVNSRAEAIVCLQDL